MKVRSPRTNGDGGLQAKQPVFTGSSGVQIHSKVQGPLERTVKTMRHSLQTSLFRDPQPTEIMAKVGQVNGPSCAHATFHVMRHFVITVLFKDPQPTVMMAKAGHVNGLSGAHATFGPS